MNTSRYWLTRTINQLFSNSAMVHYIQLCDYFTNVRNGYFNLLKISFQLRVCAVKCEHLHLVEMFLVIVVFVLLNFRYRSLSTATYASRQGGNKICFEWCKHHVSWAHFTWRKNDQIRRRHCCGNIFS